MRGVAQDRGAHLAIVLREELAAGVDGGANGDTIVQIVDAGDAADQQAVLAYRRVGADAGACSSSIVM